MKWMILVVGLYCSGVGVGAEQSGISDPNAYVKGSRLQLDDAMAFLEGIEIGIRDRILDVGCGNGAVTGYIADTCTRGIVTGVDVSESMIVFSSENSTKSNLLFVQADAAHLPFYQQFDKIFSFNALHWVLAQQSALHSMHKSLKKGGKIFLLFPAKSKSNISAVAEGVIAMPKWKALFPLYKPTRAYFTAAEYGLLLDKASFQIESLVTVKNTFTFKDRDELTAFVKPLLNFISHLDTTQQEDFTDDMVEVYWQASVDNQEFVYESLRVIATAK